MTLTVWRKALHKLIVVTGLMALMAIGTGTTVAGSPQELTLTKGNFKNKIRNFSPMLMSQCERKSWLDDILLSQIHKDGEVCTITKGGYEQRKRLAYVHR